MAETAAPPSSSSDGDQSGLKIGLNNRLHHQSANGGRQKETRPASDALLPKPTCSGGTGKGVAPAPIRKRAISNRGPEGRDRRERPEINAGRSTHRQCRIAATPKSNPAARAARRNISGRTCRPSVSQPDHTERPARHPTAAARADQAALDQQIVMAFVLGSVHLFPQNPKIPFNDHR
jgi:hypothetical protein